MIRILLTGLPGSGKSTTLLKVIKLLRAEELKVGGFITPEIRVKGRRIGFKVVDFCLGREGILASSKRTQGPRVGRYRINVREFEEIALPALDYAENMCNIICIDEIGRMELYSQNFTRRIKELFKSEKPIVAVVHRDFVKTYGTKGIILTVTPENRENLVETICSLIITRIKKI
jgi:nucleoside-triphosphatase